MRSRPLWPIGAAEWSRAVAGVQAFAERWDGAARAAGWSLLELYGVHRRAPYARLSTMGAAWLVARARYRAVSVDAAAIAVTSPAGNRLRIDRSLPDPMPRWPGRSMRAVRRAAPRSSARSVPVVSSDARPRMLQNAKISAPRRRAECSGFAGLAGQLNQRKSKLALGGGAGSLDAGRDSVPCGRSLIRLAGGRGC